MLSYQWGKANFISQHSSVTDTLAITSNGGCRQTCIDATYVSKVVFVKIARKPAPIFPLTLSTQVRFLLISEGGIKEMWAPAGHLF